MITLDGLEETIDMLKVLWRRYMTEAVMKDLTTLAAKLALEFSYYVRNKGLMWEYQGAFWPGKIQW